MVSQHSTREQINAYPQNVELLYNAETVSHLIIKTNWSLIGSSIIKLFILKLFRQLCLWCRFTCSSATSTGHIRLTVATSRSLSSRSPHPVHTWRGKMWQRSEDKEDQLSSGILLLAKNCIGMKRLIRNYRFMHLSTSLNFNVSDHQ